MPRVLVLFNEPTLPADHPDAESEHDILFTADAVVKALSEANLSVARLGVTDDIGHFIESLRTIAPDVVCNLYEGTATYGESEAHLAGLLEWLGVPFTGSLSLALRLARSKPLTKHLLSGAGIATPQFFVIDSLPCPPNPVDWPVIVKPGREDASVGIDQHSVVTNQKQLADRVAYILDTYGPPVLVEEFIDGREFNVGLVESLELRTLPFTEILFPDRSDPALWPIVSFDAKWKPGTRDFKATPAVNPANVDPTLHESIETIAKRCFHLLECRDYARIDFRVDKSGKPFVLEVNPNPCISPLAGFAAGLESAGIGYPDFLFDLVRTAHRRAGSLRNRVEKSGDGSARFS